MWRGEYLVAKLEGLDENIKENNVTVLRTKRIAFPDGDFVFPLAKTLPVVDSDLYFRLSIQGRPDDDNDEEYEPSDDDEGGGDDIPPPDDPPPPGRISTDDLQRMFDERHEADQSFHHHGSGSIEAHPPTEPTTEPIRAESVVIPESEADAQHQGGKRSSSSKSKPKSPEDTRRNPKFDVFVDYDLDPNVMPNGKPTPKGFVWDIIRQIYG